MFVVLKMKFTLFAVLFALQLTLYVVQGGLYFSGPEELQKKYPGGSESCVPYSYLSPKLLNVSNELQIVEEMLV